jgi:protein involved in polysaccharide export with SLBB domain
LGRVKKPGRISLPATRDLTLSGAIQQAGGYDTSAKENAIRITRKQPGGGVKKWEVDLRSVGAEGLIENDVLMEPDDVVYIPQLIF